MVWLLVLGLLAWAGILTFQVRDLQARARWLERRAVDLKNEMAELEARLRRPQRGALERTDAPTEAAPTKAQAATNRALGEVLEALKTPAQPPEPIRREAPAPPQPVPAPTAAAASPRIAAPKGPAPREQVRAWLEQNGLAWAGGLALALGGLFLVTYAAQRGLFTPAMRIASAAAVGAALLVGGEWLKRRSGHPLASALASGAGAATLYGAAWASYWLYAFVGLPTAGVLMAMISGGLLALAFRHGEPLAVLAILGAFLAPAITGPSHWSAPALTAYLGLIALTGYAIVAARAWGWTGLATLVGCLLWAGAGLTVEGYGRVLVLALAPFVLACGASEWRRRRGDSFALAEAAGPVSLGPVAALACASGLLALLPGFAASPDLAGLGASALALLAAAAARRGLFPARFLPLGWTPAVGFALLLKAPAELAARQEAWSAVLIAVLAVAGSASVGRRETRTARLAAGAAAAVVLLLAMRIHGPLSQAAPWAGSVWAALLLLLAGAWVARRADSPETDLPLAVWIWAAGAAALYAVTRAVPTTYLPLAGAAVSLAAAAAQARIGWRGFAGVMLSAAAGVLAALVTPDQLRDLAEGRTTIQAYTLIFAASAGLVYAGAWIMGRTPRLRESAEAQSTLALIVTVAGIVVLLRLLASGGAYPLAVHLDIFVESSLRTLTILVAGLSAALAVRSDSSVIGRWRGQLLLLLGLFQAIVFQALYANPLWASWTPAVAGPRLLDSLALGFLAPAALLAVATWRRVSLNRPLLAIYGLGAAFFLGLWSVEETRRLFQGASLHSGLDGIGRAEAAAYATLALAGAHGALWLGGRAATRPMTISTFAPEIARIGRWGGWAALALALLVFGWGASPWWGPVERPLAGARATGLLFALYAAGGAAAFLLTAPAEKAGAPSLARGLRLGVAAIAFALLNLLVRFSFRGYDMRPDLREAGLETWTFSAVWGLYGFGLLIYGAARRSSDLRLAGLVVLALTLAKIFLFDMSRLDGVVRAGSFLAVGALLLTAAVLVRRLGGAQALSLGLGRGADPASER